MKIVIDISEELYQSQLSNEWTGNVLIHEAIVNGTPVPMDAVDRVMIKEYLYSLGMGINVTPQPKMGRWVKTIGENGVTSALRCSECGFEDNRYELFNYCPTCGAKMIERNEE